MLAFLKLRKFAGWLWIAHLDAGKYVVVVRVRVRVRVRVLVTAHEGTHYSTTRRQNLWRTRMFSSRWMHRAGIVFSANPVLCATRDALHGLGGSAFVGEMKMTNLAGYFDNVQTQCCPPRVTKTICP